MKVNLFYFLIFFISFNSYANTQRIYVFHINGVNTQPGEAASNMRALRDNGRIDNNMITWDVLYNETHGVLTSDLWDVMRMKKQEGRDVTIDDLVFTYMKAYGLSYPYDSDEYNKLKDELFSKYKQDPDFSGINLNYIINQFHSKIGDINNSYVLLVSHSQGNLYANQLWDYLLNMLHFPWTHIALFGIASPASEIKGIVEAENGGQKYVTASNDYVIKTLRMLAPVLQPTTYINTSTDILGHSLQKAYLTDPDTKNYIYERIVHFIFSLRNTLVEEGMDNGNIKFLFDIKSENKSQLIFKNGKLICKTFYSNDNPNIYRECDGNLVSFIDTDYASQMGELLIGYSDKFPAGEYFYVTDFIPDAYINYLGTIYGNLKSALRYEVNYTCTGIVKTEMMSPYKDPVYNANFAFIGSAFPYPQEKCSANLPQLFHNGKLILTKIILN